MNRGNVTTSQLVTWAIGLMIFTLGGIAVSIQGADAKIEKVKEDVANTVKDIAVLGVRGEQYDKDITRINAKLDALLEVNNVSPSTIEKRIISAQTTIGKTITTQ